MRKAFAMNHIEGEIGAFLDQKLADLADFLRNTRG